MRSEKMPSGLQTSILVCISFLMLLFSSMEDNSYFIVQNCFHKFIICILQIIVHVKVYILKHFIQYDSVFQHLKTARS